MIPLASWPRTRPKGIHLKKDSGASCPHCHTLKKVNFRLGIFFYLHRCMNKISISFKVQKLLLLTGYIFTLLECVLYNSINCKFSLSYSKLKYLFRPKAFINLLFSRVVWNWITRGHHWLWLLYLVWERNFSLCSNAKHVALISYFEFLKIVPN